MRITIIGSLNYDLVTYTDRVPDAGETYQANSFENHLGGKGLNEAIATARLLPKTSTIPVRMIGNVGDDSFGKELKQALVDASVDTSYVKTIPNKSSGVAVILVEKSNGENRILITPGANGDLKPTNEEYSEYFPSSSDTEFVVLQNEYPDTLKTIQWIKTNRPHINIAYNPSPFKTEGVTSELWKQIDLLIVNEGEALDVAAFLLQEDELHEFETTIAKDKVAGFSQLASKLQSLINHENIQTVVITMGGSGSIYTTKGQEPRFEGSKKVQEVVDTTGAGDTFFGGIVSKLASGATIEDAVKFATTASSIVIQKKGAVESIPKYEDIEN